MPGEGKSHKTYVVTIAEEETAFKTEGDTQRAVGGPIQEQPSLTRKNTPLKVTKHDELGMNHKVEKGGSEHTFGFPYAIEQWSALYHLLGGLIEQTHIVGVADSTGFNVDDEISIGSAIIGVASAVSATTITLKKFTIGESVTITGGATGVIDRIKNDKIYVITETGTPSASGTVVGDSSAAKVSYSAYASGVFTMTDQPAVGDTITNDGGTTTETITVLTYHHYIFVYREPPSFSLFYNYASAVSQHNLFGAVCSDINVKGSGNEIPKMTENWFVSTKTPDTTKDPAINNSTTDLYKYEQLDLVINSIDYSELVKTREISLKRDLARLFTNSLDPSGIKGPSVESQVKLGMYRTDYEFYNLNINDTNFPVVMTWTRGLHSAAITFATCKGMEFTESENDKSIFIDMPFEIEGTPTAVIIDDVPNYGL